MRIYDYLCNKVYRQRYNAFLLGYISEIFVILILRISLHKILTHRYRNHFGEIDIVTCKKQTISFIEVKARCNMHLEDCFSWQQQKRIKKAAQCFLAHYYPAYEEVRLLVYFIDYRRFIPRISRLIWS